MGKHIRRGPALTIALSACVIVSASSAQSKPELFARGIVSTDAPEFAASFTPDGREVYFNRASADRSTLTIMLSTKSASGDWSPATVAPFSGTFRDVDPFVAPDGRRLFFTSDRPRQPGGARVFATWSVERIESGWGAPIDPGPPLNSTAGDVFFTMARDGTAFFTSSRNGMTRIFSTHEKNGHWITPQTIMLGAAADGSNPAVAPSGRFIVLVRVLSGTATDLFVSCRERQGWSEPRPLAAINSRYADFAPSIDAAERILTFTSERPGIIGAQPDGVRPPGDIYRVSLDAAGIHCP